MRIGSFWAADVISSLAHVPSNATVSLCFNAFTGKVKDISNGIFSKVSQLTGTIQTQEKRVFERKTGFWNTAEDEVKSGFFTKLIPRESQREHWYKVTPYVAEFWCTVSNVGFIYVGMQHKSPELVFAGIASIANHAIPKQWLLTLDKIGVAVALSKLARNYEGIINNAWLLLPVTAAGVIITADTYLAHTKPQTWPHVTWHLSAAYLSDVVLKNL